MTWEEETRPTRERARRPSKAPRSVTPDVTEVFTPTDSLHPFNGLMGARCRESTEPPDALQMRGHRPARREWPVEKRNAIPISRLVSLKQNG
ncbi:hypothetical protein HPB47_011796 [Ixodes persulcatus]|uniref:Uncharacterized protein n=1 Tax=Ixodes persulcatus TaxID=34615 RepID=A0AC60NVA1_IXOPE|nr:hypothetical protein HPB47_011796 [Ixodes persulcatus]